MRCKKEVFTCIQCVLTSPIQFFNNLGLIPNVRCVYAPSSIDDPESIKQEAVQHFQDILCYDGLSNVHAEYLDN